MSFRENEGSRKTIAATSCTLNMNGRRKCGDADEAVLKWCLLLVRGRVRGENQCRDGRVFTRVDIECRREGLSAAYACSSALMEHKQQPGSKLSRLSLPPKGLTLIYPPLSALIRCRTSRWRHYRRQIPNIISAAFPRFALERWIDNSARNLIPIAREAWPCDGISAVRDLPEF